MVYLQTFFVSDLSPFYEDECWIPSLKSNFSQEEDKVGEASSLFATKDPKFINLVGELISGVLIHPGCSFSIRVIC